MRQPAWRQRATPLHWSFLLGAISLSCLTVLAVTGAYLLAFYDPSRETVSYDGSYPLLRGVPVSKAYASTLQISFEVPGGLLARQAHHWAAVVLPAALLLQLLTTFFTGGFRRPRHWSWVLLTLTFVLALVGGWSGYGLPDDLLAGTGLRIVEGILIGLPVVGTRASFVVFGGEYPGNIVEHMYWLHLAVVPVLLLVLAVRLRLAIRRRPAQSRSPGRTEDNVIGLPLQAVAVRAVGLFLVTAGVLTLLAGLVEINPIWLYGPSSAGHASAGSQPDWYTSFLDGGLRLAPSGWDVEVLGRTVPLAVLLPQLAVGVFICLVVLWPFLEGRASGDRAEHHVLDRPREHPVRTGFGVAGLVFFVTLWVAGATDVVTARFGIAFEHQILALRTVVILGPLVAFQIARQLCIALAEREQDQLLHGVETGRIVRSPEGGYTEIHRPVSESRRAVTSSARIK
jgi:ubiquinol-cytochrome c reductase cytochrome b subunit